MAVDIVGILEKIGEGKPMVALKILRDTARVDIDGSTRKLHLGDARDIVKMLADILEYESDFSLVVASYASYKEKVASKIQKLQADLVYSK